MPRGTHKGGWYSVRTGAGGSCRKYKQWDDVWSTDWKIFFKRKLPDHNEKKYPVGSLWSLQMQNSFPHAKFYYRNAARYLKVLQQHTVANPTAKNGSQSSLSTAGVGGSSSPSTQFLQRERYMLKHLEGTDLEKKVQPRTNLFHAVSVQGSTATHPMLGLMADVMSSSEGGSCSSTTNLAGSGSSSSSSSAGGGRRPVVAGTSGPSLPSCPLLSQAEVDAVAELVGELESTYSSSKIHTALERNRDAGGMKPALTPSQNEKIRRLAALVEQYGVDAQTTALTTEGTNFLLHKLHKICAQHELYWNDPRLVKHALEMNTNTANASNSSVIPYVEESASTIAELHTGDVLYTRFRTKRRHHPYWIEIERVHRNWKKHHLHNIRIAKEERKARIRAWKAENNPASGVVSQSSAG
ncbi:unnamed protein product [Amoebophrya sp. A120]|nr:unnamed protein product [Amoebophrya sp. A120]|eukprot:GSA120T00006082001.1